MLLHLSSCAAFHGPLVAAVLLALTSPSQGHHPVLNAFVEHPATWTKGHRALHDEQVDVTIGIAAATPRALEDLFWSVSDPTNAAYGRHLSADEADALTSPRPDAVPSITRWLAEHDIADVVFSPATNRLKVRGSVRSLEAVFATEIHAYNGVAGHPVGRGNRRILRASQPLAMPPSMLSDVSYISLNAHPLGRLLAAQGHGKQHGNESKSNKSSTVDSVRDGGGITPAFLREWYGVPRQTSANETNAQGIPEFYEEAWTDKDLSIFFNKYMDGDAIPTLVTHQVPSRDDTEGQASAEASLDLQYITALAPRTTTYVWSQSGSNPFSAADEPFVEWAEDILTMKQPPYVVSLSYADDEEHIFAASEAYARSFDPLLMKLGVRGVSVFVASGDDGVAGQRPGLRKTNIDNKSEWCKQHGPQWPTSSPYVTSVGATMLSKLTDSSGFFNTLDEVVCTSSLGSAITSGGGFSTQYARPAYQDAAVQGYLATRNIPPPSFFNVSGRAYPDVTAFGHDYIVVLNGDKALISGTSASTPALAAMITLVNDLRLNAGKPALGFLNPTLYRLQAAYPLAFHDIITGTNAAGMGPAMPVCDLSFHAESGWDAVSGLGSPNFPVLSQLLLNVEDVLSDTKVLANVPPLSNQQMQEDASGSVKTLVGASVAALVAAVAVAAAALVYVKRHARKAEYCELDVNKGDTPKYPSQDKTAASIFTIDDEDEEVELTEVTLDR
ncbi:hypothetical protein DYB38_010828 [Aphanomyces astaci]|uniref:subtilisin n=1 Tax=Aphanomyces astaci TaxID=112090 RepID=A0A397CTB7_APHAT|nr:hypothetical protein DYB38_010828 [Aphanomyces astaci]